MRRDALGTPGLRLSKHRRARVVTHVSLRHRFAYEDFTANVEEEERDFQHALDMSAAIELGNESPIATSSDDDEEGEEEEEDSVTFYARVRSF